jgi:hypothetical protein
VPNNVSRLQKSRRCLGDEKVEDSLLDMPCIIGELFYGSGEGSSASTGDCGSDTGCVSNCAKNSGGHCPPLGQPGVVYAGGGRVEEPSM